MAVTQVTEDVERNVREIPDAIAQASKAGADLVLFSEAAVTGLVNNDDPAHDLPLGQPIPGPVTARVAQVARDHSIYVGLGLLEREAQCLYDSAVLLDPEGRIVLKYRRISLGWRDRGSDPSVYREGDSIRRVDTALGSFAFLICGDLFEEALAERVRSMGIDYVLYPISRNYDSSIYDQERWDRETRAEYVARARLTGATVLLVNQLGAKEFDGGTFGGAMVVSPSGQILAELPLGRTGVLVANI